MSQQKNLAGIDNQERILSIDVIRGFAVMGIFLITIQIFIQQGGQNPLASNSFDRKVYDILAMFALGKFHFIFAFLFGANSNIFITKLKNKNLGPWRYIRRMGILLIIGFLLSIVYGGDALIAYAISGFFLFPFFFKAKMKWLLLFGLFLTFFSEIYYLTHGVVQNYFSDILLSSIHEAPLLDKIIFITTTAGHMVLGFVIYQLGFFTKDKDKPFLKKLTLSLFILTIIVWSISYLALHDNNAQFFLVFVPGMFYISLIKLILTTDVGTTILQKFQSYGKMSLSNLMIETILGVTLIRWLAHFHYFSSLEVIGFCLVFFFVMVNCSTIWLRYFRYGPVEWLWRSITYLSIQPMLRK